MPRQGAAYAVLLHTEVLVEVDLSSKLNTRQAKIFKTLERLIKAGEPVPTVSQLGVMFKITQQAMSKNLKALEEAELIRRNPHKHRSIELMRPAPKALAIKLLGRITAGSPLEQMETSQMIVVPAGMVPKGHAYALEVTGDSMIDDGILDGDIVIIKRQSMAYDGQTVVAILNGEATLKRYYHEGSRIRLQPANANMAPFFAMPEDEFEIRGVVHGLFRTFEHGHC